MHDKCTIEFIRLPAAAYSLAYSAVQTWRHFNAWYVSRPSEIQNRNLYLFVHGTVETAFYDHSFGTAKTSLKQEVVFETRVKRPKPTLFISSNWSGRHPCGSKFTQKVVQSLHNPKTRYMCNVLWSYTPGEWLCVCKIWQLLVTFRR